MLQIFSFFAAAATDRSFMNCLLICFSSLGTVESLVSSNGHMSKEEYDSIGRKKAPNFSGNRDVVYEMFKRYRKMCIDKNLLMNLIYFAMFTRD